MPTTAPISGRVCDGDGPPAGWAGLLDGGAACCCGCGVGGWRGRGGGGGGGGYALWVARGGGYG
jgi:hypothetical protein